MSTSSSVCLSNWLLSKDDSDPDAQLSRSIARNIHLAEGMVAVVGHCPSVSIASQEAQTLLAATLSKAKSFGHKRSSGSINAWETTCHLASLIQHCPIDELDKSSAGIQASFNLLLRSQELAQTRVQATSALETFCQRMVRSSNATSGTQSRRSTIIGMLPKVVPLLLNGAGEEGKDLGVGTQVAAASLACLALLVDLLRTSMRPFAGKIEACAIVMLDAYSQETRDAAAKCMSSLPLCGDSSAWCSTLTRMSLEAHSLVEGAWPDPDFNASLPGIGSADQLNILLAGPQRIFSTTKESQEHEKDHASTSPADAAGTLYRRFHALTNIIRGLLETGSITPVATPVNLLVALVERVSRIHPRCWSMGELAVLQNTQNADSSLRSLSPLAMHLALPRLLEDVGSLLAVLCRVPPSVLFKHGSRIIRAVVGGLQRSLEGNNVGEETQIVHACIAVKSAAAGFGPGAAQSLAGPCLPLLINIVKAALTGDSCAHSTKQQGMSLSQRAQRGDAPQAATSARKTSNKSSRKSKQSTAADTNGTHTNTNINNSNSLLEGQYSTGGSYRSVMCALEAISSLVLHCGSHFSTSLRTSVESFLMYTTSVLISKINATNTSPGGSSIGLTDTCYTSYLNLVKVCILQPMSDGSRSTLVPLYSTLCKLSTHTYASIEVHNASTEGLLVCGALLHPRAAPLSIPPNLFNADTTHVNNSNSGTHTAYSGSFGSSSGFSGNFGGSSGFACSALAPREHEPMHEDVDVPDAVVSTDTTGVGKKDSNEKNNVVVAAGRETHQPSGVTSSGEGSRKDAGTVQENSAGKSAKSSSITQEKHAGKKTSHQQEKIPPATSTREPGASSKESLVQGKVHKRQRVDSVEKHENSSSSSTKEHKVPRLSTETHDNTKNTISGKKSNVHASVDMVGKGKGKERESSLHMGGNKTGAAVEESDSDGDFPELVCSDPDDEPLFPL